MDAADIAKIWNEVEAKDDVEEQAELVVEELKAVQAKNDAEEENQRAEKEVEVEAENLQVEEAKVEVEAEDLRVKEAKVEVEAEDLQVEEEEEAEILQAEEAKLEVEDQKLQSQEEVKAQAEENARLQEAASKCDTHIIVFRAIPSANVLTYFMSLSTLKWRRKKRIDRFWSQGSNLRTQKEKGWPVSAPCIWNGATSLGRRSTRTASKRLLQITLQWRPMRLKPANGCSSTNGMIALQNNIIKR